MQQKRVLHALKTGVWEAEHQPLKKGSANPCCTTIHHSLHETLSAENDMQPQCRFTVSSYPLYSEVSSQHTGEHHLP